MKISTKTGDLGKTSLMFGRRVSKASERTEAYGAVDEFSSTIGLARAFCQDADLNKLLETIQLALVKLMTELATSNEDFSKLVEKSIPLLEETDLSFIEGKIDAYEKSGVCFNGWIQPCSNPCSAALSLARAQTRRAERRVVILKEKNMLSRDLPLIYLNRLSDLIWLISAKLG